MTQDLKPLIELCLKTLQELYPEIEEVGDLKAVTALTKCCETKRSDDFRGKTIERISDEKKELSLEAVGLKMAIADLARLEPKIIQVLTLYGIKFFGGDIIVDTKVIEKLLTKNPVN